MIGYDVSKERVTELSRGTDFTLEVTEKQLTELNFSFTNNAEDISDCEIFIVTIPIDMNKQPDLKPLISATKTIANFLKRGDLVVYESTVYPGATEEVCVPILENGSGLIFNEEFFVGYSPERINPGDKSHRLTDITKVVSASSSDASKLLDSLYSSIVKAGTYIAPSIRVAEAAKVIENTQRDLNIALMNELSIIFNKLEIDTEEVLKAAETKWNFLPFRPGLVGGHCIGVDPYYLSYKAQSIGHYPMVISAGRSVNDSMGKYVSGQLLKKMLGSNIEINQSKVLIMGLSFKENCPDIRNTRVIDIIQELNSNSICVDVFDPWVDPAEAKNEYDILLIDQPKENSYDAIVIAVAHEEFKRMGGPSIRTFGKSKHILYDLKYILSPNESDFRL